MVSKKKRPLISSRSIENTMYEKNKIIILLCTTLINFLILPHSQISMGKQQYPEGLATKMLQETVSHEEKLKELSVKPGKGDSGQMPGKRGTFL